MAILNWIFPADAGVNLIILSAAEKQFNIPRGCGGEPFPPAGACPNKLYSPRMQG